VPEPDGLQAMLDGFAEELEHALLAADLADAERVARDALTAGLPASLIDDHVVRPGMRSVGERWARGELTVRDEQRATQIVLRLLGVLREVHRAEQDRLETTVLLCAPEGERHVVGLLMAADLLEDSGYNIVLAGADVPEDLLARLLAQHRPDLLGLTATMPESASGLRANVALAHDAGITGILLGGAIAGRALDPSPQVYTLDGVAGVVSAADGLLRRAGVN
jgi:MerR family transcriptional regulator, light-induced transcriptional regulator